MSVAYLSFTPRHCKPQCSMVGAYVTYRTQNFTRAYAPGQRWVGRGEAGTANA